MTVPVFLIRCHLCNDHNFSSKRKCRDHYESKHSILIEKTSQGGRPPKQAKLGSTDKDNFSCPACSYHFQTMKELGSHVTIHFKSQYFAASSDSNENFEKSSSEHSEESDSEANINQENIVTLSNSVSLPKTQLPVPVVMVNYRRNHDEALLHACQRASNSEESKHLTRYAIKTLNLEPFSIINEQGEEENALAHFDVISKASQSKSSSIIPIIPIKRSANEMEKNTLFCNNCSISNPIPLYKSLTSHAPYPKLLNTRNYIELSDDLCEFLNRDWTLSPQMKYASAQLLAGCIIQNQLNGQVIIANTVEVYGRKKNVDIHREPFGTKKKSAIATSLPPPVSSRYDNVYPVTLNSQHGPKLVIGTQTMNYLITSFVRLDKEEEPSMGAVSTSFKLETLEESLATRIYIDEYALNRAMKLAENNNANSVTNYNIIDQLRQVGTHFESPSTYYLCRASGYVTRAHQCQPYSIFSLSNFDRGRCPSAKIFSSIADDVLLLGSQGILRKSVVEDSLSSGNKEIEKVVGEILALYKNDSDTIYIIGNTQLNSLLEQLAALLLPYINSANNTVATAINDTFNFFKK